MGHKMFNRCGLSSEIDFTYLNLKHLKKLLKKQSSIKSRHVKTMATIKPTSIAGLFSLYPLKYNTCHRLIDEHEGNSATTNENKQCTSEEESSKVKYIFSCFSAKQTEEHLDANDCYIVMMSGEK